MEKPFVVLDSIAGARIGPLADHLNAYLSLLRGQGYAPGSARIHVQVIARFSQWLRRKGIEVHDLDQSIVERFLQGRRDARSASRGDAATLSRFLRMLRQNGVTREERRAAPSRLEKIAEDYRRYLLQERGLSQATAVNYLPFIDQFLSERFEGCRLNLSQLRAPDVTSFVQRHARDFSPGRGKHCSSPPFGLFLDTCSIKGRSRPIWPLVCLRWPGGHSQLCRSFFQRATYRKC